MRPKVAVIGGGVSGLGVAYNLLKKLGRAVRVRVFEKKSYLGGNCYTATSDFGGQKTYVDLGVADFNLNNYKLLSKVFDEFGVEHADITNLLT